MTPVTLWEYATTLYFPLNIKCRSADTRYQYDRAIRLFGRFLGRDARPDDLQDDLLTAWMSAMMAQGMATVTVRETAGRVSALWTWLAKRGVISRFPTFAKPRVPETMPTALTESQIRSLFRSAAKERGAIGDIPADLWWTSFLAFIWTTAERKSAALAVKVAWIDFHAGCCTIPPDVRKGGQKWACYRLWPETLKLLADAINAKPQREQMWPHDFCHESYYTRYNRILRDAGIPVNRRTKTHALRCSHATYLELRGGDPTRQLGHSDSATTRRYYLDPKLTTKEQPQLFIPWRHPDAG